MKILKISKKFFFFKNFRDYTCMKEHSSETPNMQKFLIFDHPSSTYGEKRVVRNRLWSKLCRLINQSILLRRQLVRACLKED